ncbi:MAG: FAD:protein FMN transferase [Candidatus Zixiibacteriota bacterium]
MGATGLQTRGLLNSAEAHPTTRRQFLLYTGGLLACTLVENTIGWAEGLAPATTQRRTLWAMGGWNLLEVTADDSSLAAFALARSVDAIREIDRTFSVFDPQSPISELNTARRLCLPLDNPLLLDGLAGALAWAGATDGAFDPAVEPLMARWGFRESVRKQDDPVSGSPHALVEIDRQRGVVTRESVRTQLDSGGWAKGMAAQRAVEAALDAGAESAQVNCGCDIFRSGTDDWRCFIRDPQGAPSDVAVRCRTRHRSVATSGNYENSRTSPRGARVGHLMDPRTALPAESDIESVTVFGDDGLAVDAVSSALFVMGSRDAVRWLNRHPDYAAVILRNGWKSDATCREVIGGIDVDWMLHG